MTTGQKSHTMGVRPSAWLGCSVYDEVVAGDHVIALLAIRGLCADPDQDPLVFHPSRFRQLSRTL